MCVCPDIHIHQSDLIGLDLNCGELVTSVKTPVLSENLFWPHPARAPDHAHSQDAALVRTCQLRVRFQRGDISGGGSGTASLACPSAGHVHRLSHVDGGELTRVRHRAHR